MTQYSLRQPFGPGTDWLLVASENGWAWEFWLKEKPDMSKLKNLDLLYGEGEIREYPDLP